MRIFAPQGIRSIGSELRNGSMTIGSVVDLASDITSVNLGAAAVNQLVSSHIGTFNLASIPAAFRSTIQSKLSGITSSISSSLNGLTTTGGLAGLTSQVTSEVTTQLAAVERTITQTLPAHLHVSVLSDIRTQASNIASNLAGDLTRSLTSSATQAIAGFESSITNQLHSVLSSGTSLLNALGGSGIGGLSDIATHKIHIGQGIINLGLGAANAITMGGGHINLTSALGHINLGGGMMQLASSIGNINLGNGGINLGSVSIGPSSVSVGGVTIGTGGISVGSASIGSSGSSLTVAGSNVVTQATLPSIPTTVNNAIYLNGQPDTYYLDLANVTGTLSNTHLSGTYNITALLANNATYLNGQAASYYLDLTNASGILANTHLSGSYNITALLANNATYLNGQLDTYYTDLTNATGTLSNTHLSGTYNITALLANNATYLNGQLDTYYTNIVARLGYTPANKAGDNFTGNVTIVASDSPKIFAYAGATKGIRFEANTTVSTIAATDNTWFSSYEPLSLSGSSIQFNAGTSATPRAIFNSNGNFGVGTTTPNNVGIHVIGPTGSHAALFTADSAGRGIRIGTNDYALSSVGSVLTLNMGAGTGNTFASLNATIGGATVAGTLVLQSNAGKLAVGNTAPATNFHVTGNTVGFYSTNAANTTTNGGQLYIGDSNFINTSYYNSAPGIGAVYSTTSTVAGDLALYAYAGATNSRSEGMRIVANGSGTFATFTNIPIANGVALTPANSAGIISGLGYTPANKAGDTFTGPVAITTTSSTSSLALSASAGQYRILSYSTAGVSRWTIHADIASESGSDVGSNLQIARYSDAGSYLDSPISITRSTGVAAFANTIQVFSGKAAAAYSPTSTFSYDSQAMAQYGLGWFSDTVDSWSSSGPTAWLTSYGGIKFFTAGAARAAITPSGAFIVGGNTSFNTTSANADLEINTRNNANHTFLRFSTTNSGYYAEIASHVNSGNAFSITHHEGDILLASSFGTTVQLGGSGYFVQTQVAGFGGQVRVQAGSTDRITVFGNTGHVGIGNTAPITRLTVTDTSSTFSASFQGSTGTRMVVLGSNTSGGVIQGYTNGYGGSASLLINPDGGNVGIGGASAGEKLEVFGYVIANTAANTTSNNIVATTAFVHNLTDPYPGAIDLEFFGNGLDGNVTISSGTTTLARDMQYQNLTVSGTGIIDCNGFKIFVQETLDISGAQAGAIIKNGPAGGAASSTSTGGAGGTPTSAGTLSTQTVGSAGNAGQTGNGSNGIAQTIFVGYFGGKSGASAAGGNGSGGRTGGTGTTATTANTSYAATPRLDRNFATVVYNTTTTFMQAGLPAGQAGSGAGDGTNRGGACGGSGTGGGIIAIFARTINRSSSSGTGTIQALGGAGGAGFAPTTGNCGGAGGAGGGGGGWVNIVYRYLTGSTKTGLIDVTGGNGAAGTNGIGTGVGADGGDSGESGRVSIFDLGAGTVTITSAVASVAGSAHSGVTGGAGGTATTTRINL